MNDSKALVQVAQGVAFDWECSLRRHASVYADVCGYSWLVLLGQCSLPKAYF